MGWKTTDSILDRRGEVVQNISQKSPSSARDFCNSYLFEKAWIKFIRIWLANVSSSARSLMTVHRSIQTHGPYYGPVPALTVPQVNPREPGPVIRTALVNRHSSDTDVW